MDKFGSLLIWLHVSANLIWIGSILAVGAILTSSVTDSKTQAELAWRVHMRLAVPAFVVSFVCGATQLFMNTSYYLVEHHWMHGKLTAAVIVIALHHVIGQRAKASLRAHQGPLVEERPQRRTVQEGRSTAMLSLVLALMAALAAFFAISRFPS